MGLLKRCERASGVRAEPSIDFTGRKTVAIEEHLKRQHVAAGATRLRRAARAFLGSGARNGRRHHCKNRNDDTGRQQVSHDGTRVHVSCLDVSSTTMEPVVEL
jgi:hypothetical protein